VRSPPRLPASFIGVRHGKGENASASPVGGLDEEKATDLIIEGLLG
jgi:hypothetical protein